MGKGTKSKHCGQKSLPIYWIQLQLQKKVSTEFLEVGLVVATIVVIWATGPSIVTVPINLIIGHPILQDKPFHRRLHNSSHAPLHHSSHPHYHHGLYCSRPTEGKSRLLSSPSILSHICSRIHSRTCNNKQQIYNQRL